MGGGFGKIPVEMYSMDISMTAKVLYSYICNGAGLGQDEAGENTVSVSDLSAGINASHGATCNAIKELYEHGLIDIKKGRPCTYVVLDIFGCQWSNSDRQRSYNDRQKSNNDHQRSYNDRPYTLYKKNIKRNSKRILKEGGEPRDEAERKFMKLACNPPTYQHDKNVVDYLEDADRRFKDPEW